MLRAGLLLAGMGREGLVELRRRLQLGGIIRKFKYPKIKLSTN
jgi:hypothetical protein